MNRRAHLLLVDDNRMDVDLSAHALREGVFPTRWRSAPTAWPRLNQVRPMSFEGRLDVVGQIDSYWLSLNGCAPLEAQ
jgi:hypothetical protein